MTKANVPPNVPPNVSDIHTYTLRTLLRVYRRTDDGKNIKLRTPLGLYNRKIASIP